MANQNFKLEKLEKVVTILVDCQPALKGACVLFLSPHSRFGSGPETLHEFLNHAPPFIPIRFPDTDSLILVNLDEIIWVHETEPAPPQPVKQQVRLSLKNSAEIGVEQTEVLPDPNSRLLDYLNGAQRFIGFQLNGTRIHINKSKITRSKEDGSTNAIQSPTGK
ncbi:MAG TPA: hypothetical protein ENN40_07220 [Candidatus Aminicenantes bacterium]|nr:hypothetical protein [Candidatus Aminicenantes bacterium]